MSIHEIRVAPIEGDLRADKLVAESEQVLGRDISGLTTVDVYYLEGLDKPETTDQIAAELLSHPITQTYEVEAREDWANPSVAEVAYRPGVENPSSASVLKGLNLLGLNAAAVDLGVEYRFPPSTEPGVVDEVLSRLVVNETIHIVRTQAPETLVITAPTPPIESVSIAGMSDEQLTATSKNRDLALSLRDMQIFRGYAHKIARDVTDAELEEIAYSRSDHCAHTTFQADLIVDGKPKAPLFSRIKEFSRPHFEKRGVLSAFDDNSGVFEFYDDTAIALKAETHISPFNLEPYGGSATGSGGVFRDIKATGKGARPVLSIDIWGVAPHREGADREDQIAPEHLLSRGLAGVRGYGNPSGIPTSNGSVYEHPYYTESKSMVLVGSVGIMEIQNVPKGIPQKGDRVIAIGGRTGRDGVHGATSLASEAADASTHITHASAVQIGYPIVQQKMFEALEEATEAGLIRAMTDCGASGFASAITEMAKDIGVWVDIANVPLKYEGLAPFEKWISESQERSVIAISPENIEAFRAICDKYEVEMTDLGFFGTPKGAPRLQVMHAEEQLINLEYDFLNNGFPNETLDAEWVPKAIAEVVPQNVDCNQALLSVLAHTNVCSKQSITRRFDHGVQGLHVLDPYGGKTGDAPSNAAVLQPIMGKPYGLTVAHGLNPSMSVIDPEWATKWAFAEAMANIVATGGDPDTAVAANNYIGPKPTPRVTGGLDIQVDAVGECVDAYETPIISGKDTNSSSKKGPDGVMYESPALVAIMAVAKFDNVEKTMTSDL
ncbi:MAG TPA: AIR synthase-related protein, partial [Candidatus Saccharimonadales bacterium]|nr:AIR synthase-related protein [Candidatus Saccharimonadales bacterium]